MKPFFLFFAAFLIGAGLAFAVRTVRHQPYADPSVPSPAPAVSPAPATHAGHPVPASPDGAVVNTVCALCGMDVDPAIPPATYRGKLVGFGCAACPPKFAREPDRYGPFALRNEVAD